MFENLDTIDWHHLHHAYGEASDVPDMIRALASSDEKVREGAIDEFYCTIWHQGTVYEATSYAVPFLVELLKNDEVQGKAAILALLFDLANGHSYKAVHQGFEAYLFGREAVNNPQYQAKMQVELYWVKQAHDAVAAGMKVYFGLVKHHDPKVRVCVPYLLSGLPEYAAEIMPIIGPRLEAENDPQVRASLLLSMGVFAADHPQKYNQFLSDLVQMENEHAFVKLAAAMTLVRLMRESIPPEAVQRLIETITHPEEVEKAYEALPWNNSGVVADIAVAFCNLKPAAASVALSSCLEALKKANSYNSLNLTRALLYFSFGHHPLLKGTTAQELTDAQKAVLTTLVECDQAWRLNANMSGILAAFGLPPWHEEMRAFLEGAQG